jgi:hypothetical protein
MKEIDRRNVVAGILCGAAVASLGLSMLPKAANSVPGRGSGARHAEVGRGQDMRVPRVIGVFCDFQAI